ncbi:MAG: hypothetical protein ACP5C3_00810 [Methanomicrobiales archaeon]
MGEDLDILDKEEQKQRNIKNADHIKKIVSKNKKYFEKMRQRVVKNYKITLVLYIIMFFWGLILLSVPLVTAILGDISLYSTLVGGLGIADLALLFLFKPVDKIHNITTDLNQITIISNGYLLQETLRLIQLDINDRESVGQTAEYIGAAAASTVGLLEQYCEVSMSDDKKTEPPKPGSGQPSDVNIQPSGDAN